MTTSLDIHERTRLRIHIMSGKDAPREQIRADIDDILTRYMAYCKTNVMRSGFCQTNKI